MFQQNYKNKYLKYKSKYLDLKYGGKNYFGDLGDLNNNLNEEERTYYYSDIYNFPKESQSVEIKNRRKFIEKIKLKKKLEEDLSNEFIKLADDAKDKNLNQGLIKSTIQSTQKKIIRINIELQYIRTNYYNYNNLSSFEQEQLIEEELDNQLLIKFRDRTIEDLKSFDKNTIVELKTFDDGTIKQIKNRILKRQEIKEKKERVSKFFVKLFNNFKENDNCFKTGTIVFEDNNNKLYNLLTFGIISEEKNCKLGDPIAQQNYFINKYKDVFKNKEVKSNDKCFEEGFIGSLEYIRGCRNKMCLTLELTFNQDINNLCDDKLEEKILRSCVYYTFKYNDKQYVFLKLLKKIETKYLETYDRNEVPTKNKYPSEQKDNNYYQKLNENLNNKESINNYNDNLRTGDEMFITEELKNYCMNFETNEEENNADSEVSSVFTSDISEEESEEISSDSTKRRNTQTDRRKKRRKINREAREAREAREVQARI